MPHFSVEYSANLESLIDMKNFCDLIRKAGLETKVFPMAGIRVRALKCEHFSIADNDPNNGFIDISCLLYTSPSPRDRTRSRMPSSA